MVFEFYISVVHLCSVYFTYWIGYFDSKGNSVENNVDAIDAMAHTIEIISDFLADLASLLVSSKSCSISF